MCAVMGVIGQDLEASRLVHSGLWALQHRGQESSGIVSSDGKNLYFHRGMGLVAHVYEEEDFANLPGNLAIGHNRYATSGPSSSDYLQPVVTKDKILALAHNGNLPDTTTLEKFFRKKGIATTFLNDSDLMHKALTYYLARGQSIEQAIKKSFPLFTGVFSILLATVDKLIAVRDSYGVRPLVMGKYNGGFVFASETCALDTIKAQYLREVKPGEMVVVSNYGLKSYQLAKSTPKLDLFEFIYFARPDSYLLGQSVNEVRRRLGKYLAKEHKIKADVVIPIPDSAIPAALGYSQESGIPFDHGLIKNRYIHRTFIRPAQKLRDKDVEMKLNPIPEILSGKRVIIIDDSIVRGTTSKKIVAMVRKAGAKKVYFLVSSPPVRYPDFYGIDTPTQKELISSRLDENEIAKEIGADAVYFLSYKSTIKATGLPEDVLCTSCFTGIYPVDIGERRKEITYL
ncbi:MAG: amidophosphoribosyltransferase [bacterium]|nr:amidophosphoribosyltransferase [bacterium]